MSEYELQCICVEYLELLKSQKKVLFFSAIPNSTFTSSWAVKIKNKNSGVRSGLPDLFIVLDTGEQIFIELKTPTGTLQPTQKEVIKILNKNSLTAYIACDFEEFESILATICQKDETYFKLNSRGSKMLNKLLS